MTPQDAYAYALTDPDPDFSMAEGVILAGKNPKWLCLYAIAFMTTRWCEAEPFIKSHPKWAYLYARNFVYGRWVEAESVIRSNSEWACLYSILVGVRWRALEHEFVKLPKYGATYWKRFFPGCGFIEGKTPYRSVDDFDDGNDLDSPPQAGSTHMP